MRMVLVGCALVLAASVEPAAAQDGWPFSFFKQAAPAKRAQPRARPKAEPAQPAATAALDPQAPQARPATPQSSPADPQAPAAEPQAQPPARPPPTRRRRLPWQWRIMRTAWTERDEKGFEEFVQRIGESGCRNVHACLTGAAVQPALPRLQPAGHALLCRLRRPALHAARLLCLEERAAVLLFDGGNAARVLQGHPLHGARQRHRQPPRPRRCRPRCAQGHAADRRHHLLGALPLSAELSGQAPARPLSR